MPYDNAGIPIKERALFLKGVYNVLGHCVADKNTGRPGIYMFCNTGNAYGAAASAGPAARSLNGHCFAGVECRFKQCPDDVMCSLLEGTKWVMPLTASGIKNADVESLRACNEISQLLLEITKAPTMDPSLDVGATLLQLYQGASVFFVSIDYNYVLPNTMLQNTHKHIQTRDKPFMLQSTYPMTRSCSDNQYQALPLLQRL